MYKRADEIKDMFRACTTVAEVDAAAKMLGADVQDLSERPAWAVHAIHIRNLAAYMRLILEE